MKQKYYLLPQIFVAFLILAVSIYKSSSVKYVFSQAPLATPVYNNHVQVDYALPSPIIGPNSLLWPLQALLDRADDTPESCLNNADSRLVGGAEMVEKGRVEDGYLVLEKASRYLEKSYELAAELKDNEAKGNFLRKISLASLKHREVLEIILLKAPDDGRAVVTTILDAPKMVYEKSSADLLLLGLTPPEYPF